MELRTDALTERYFAAAGERDAAEEAARGEVTTWRTFTGRGNPLDPAPLAALAAGIKPARPWRDADPPPTLEVGLAADGRARICLRHGVGRPWCTVWLREPGGLLAIGWQDELHGAPTHVAWLATDDTDRVLTAERLGSTETWPSARPTASERAQILSEPFVVHAHDRYEWEAGRVVRIRTRSLRPRFDLVTEFEYGARGAATPYRVLGGQRTKLRVAG